MQVEVLNVEDGFNDELPEELVSFDPVARTYQVQGRGVKRLKRDQSLVVCHGKFEEMRTFLEPGVRVRIQVLFARLFGEPGVCHERTGVVVLHDAQGLDIGSGPQKFTGQTVYEILM